MRASAAAASLRAARRLSPLRAHPVRLHPLPQAGLPSATFVGVTSIVKSDHVIIFVGEAGMHALSKDGAPAAPRFSRI